MKLTFSPAALRDLRDIADWIAGDDADIAYRFASELETKARAILAMPLAFPFAPHSADFGIRKRSYGDYLILYRATSDRVRKLRIVNGKRDYAALFR